MSSRACELLQDVQTVLGVCEEVVQTAVAALKPGPRRRRVAFDTARAWLLEQRLEPPDWVLQLALELAWRRAKGEAHAFP